MPFGGLLDNSNASGNDDRNWFTGGKSRAPVIDASVPASPIVSTDDPNFSGGLLGRPVALAGIDPQNPNQPAPLMGPARPSEQRGAEENSVIRLSDAVSSDLGIMGNTGSTQYKHNPGPLSTLGRGAMCPDICLGSAMNIVQYPKQ